MGLYVSLFSSYGDDPKHPEHLPDKMSIFNARTKRMLPNQAWVLKNFQNFSLWYRTRILTAVPLTWLAIILIRVCRYTNELKYHVPQPIYTQNQLLLTEVWTLMKLQKIFFVVWNQYVKIMFLSGCKFNSWASKEQTS